VISRLKHAWHVLMGVRVTPLQIQAEWTEYQQIFNDQLERLSAYLARAAKAEKERVRRIQETLEEASPDVREVPHGDRHALKAELRRRVLAGGAAPQHQLRKEARPE